MKAQSITNFIKLKKNNQKFATVTCYDSSFSQIIEQAEIPLILIGDSLGMVVQGKSNTLSVTVDDISYHTKCVAATNHKSLLMADMPFMSYQNPKDACFNAAKLIQSGAHMVKLEGGIWLKDTISMLTERAIPVCAHIGLTPQSVNIFGGFKIQGKTNEDADRIINEALRLQNAGAQLLVIECVPENLATEVTKLLDIPVIGIGAGKNTDGQILVLHDILGISSGYIPKFAQNFLEKENSILDALKSYKKSVELGLFPSKEHIF